MIDEILRSAREAWPEIEIAPEVFAAYLIERMPKAGDGVGDSDSRDSRDTRSVLSSLRTNDLYLACACARGDARAMAAFERCCLSVLDEALPRISGVDSDIVDDVKQQLRRRLLVADSGPPRILEFAGRGDLRRWVRVMGVREALTITRRLVRETRVDDSFIEKAILPAGDPEIEYLKRRYQHDFTSACAAALQRLDVRERTLLRQSFVDGLTIDELGALYRVHRATAARWLTRAQAAFTTEIHATLMRTLQLQPAELHSILRLIRSGLQVNLRGLLASWQTRKQGDADGGARRA